MIALLAQLSQITLVAVPEMIILPVMLVMISFLEAWITTRSMAELAMIFFMEKKGMIPYEEKAEMMN